MPSSHGYILIYGKSLCAGGLGVESVKFKALAILIRCFLETAVNPQFQQSLFHSALYRFHILKDNSIPDPGYTPYYSQSFFEAIEQVGHLYSMNVERMTIKDWSRCLTECRLTKDMMSGQFFPSRAEIITPNNDWINSWRLIRLKGLDSNLASFNFKLIHGLLVTKKRKQELKRLASSCCTHCDENVEEDLKHALFECNFNNNIGNKILTTLQQLDEDINPEKILSFDLRRIEEVKELPAMIFTYTGLMEIWNKRSKNSRINLYDIRSTLEARCLLLRETRFRASGDALEDMLRNFQ